MSGGEHPAHHTHRRISLTRGELLHLFEQLEPHRYQRQDDNEQERLSICIPQRFRYALQFDDHLKDEEERWKTSEEEEEDKQDTSAALDVEQGGGTGEEGGGGERRRGIVGGEVLRPTSSNHGAPSASSSSSSRQTRGLPSGERLPRHHSLLQPIRKFLQTYTFLSLLHMFWNWCKNRIELTKWARAYDWRENLRGDVVAGLTLGAMLVPQGMAYAIVAGLPPVTGLYTAVVPQFIYAICGTSRHLAVGPVAILSLLQANALKNVKPTLADGSPNPHYVTAALTTAFFVGVIQVSMSIFRLGFLVNFLSHPVIAAFTSASAIIIGVSQLNAVFGFNFDKVDSTFVTIYNFFAGLGHTHLPTFAFGIASIIFLLVIRKIQLLKRVPGALVVVFVCTLVMWQTHLNTSRKIGITGSVPAGAPKWTTPNFASDTLGETIVSAVVMSLIGYMESSAVAKIYATKNRYQIDSNQELFALGLSNLIGSFFGSYPSTGSFSRTAVNSVSGAKTLVSSIISGTTVLIVLLLITQWFYYLPKPVLGAIVVAAVVNLFDLEEPRFLWRVSRTDFFVYILTFVLVMQFGVEIGLGVSVGISMFAQILRSAIPTFAILGRIPGTHVFRNIERFRDLETSKPGVLILRFDKNLNFANVGRFVDILSGLFEDNNNNDNAKKKNGTGSRIKPLVMENQNRNSNDGARENNNDNNSNTAATTTTADNGGENNNTTATSEIRISTSSTRTSSSAASSASDSKVKIAVLDFSAVTDIDATAIHSLHECFHDFHESGRHIFIANTKGPLRDSLRKSGLAKIIGPQNIFLNIEDAVEAAENLVVKINRTERERDASNGSRTGEESSAGTVVGLSDIELTPREATRDFLMSNVETLATIVAPKEDEGVAEGGGAGVGDLAVV